MTKQDNDLFSSLVILIFPGGLQMALSETSNPLRVMKQQSADLPQKRWACRMVLCNALTYNWIQMVNPQTWSTYFRTI